MQSQPDALIGHTGFVGGALERSGWSFDARFNSSSIDGMRNGQFGTVICAGVSAVKWRANREPDADRAGIGKLVDVLDTIRAQRFVLISTVDVYPNPVDVTEDDCPDPDLAQPYGRHRLELERWVAARFPVHHIVRLPALFGPGLKKNALFDLLTGNETEKVNPNGFYQWYPLDHLADDLRQVIAARLTLLNVAVEPLRMGDIAAQMFPDLPIGPDNTLALRYDMRTRHAAVLGGHGCYHLDAVAAVAEIAKYVAAVRRDGGTP